MEHSMKILNEKMISWTSWFSVTSVWYNGCCHPSQKRIHYSQRILQASGHSKWSVRALVRNERFVWLTFFLVAPSHLGSKEKSFEKIKPLQVPTERPGVWVPPSVHLSRDGKAMEDNRVTLETQHVPLPSKWQEGFQSLIYLSKIITACQISKFNREDKNKN